MCWEHIQSEFVVTKVRESDTDVDSEATACQCKFQVDQTSKKSIVGKDTSHIPIASGIRVMMMVQFQLVSRYQYPGSMYHHDVDLLVEVDLNSKNKPAFKVIFKFCFIEVRIF